MSLPVIIDLFILNFLGWLGPSGRVLVLHLVTANGKWLSGPAIFSLQRLTNQTQMVSVEKLCVQEAVFSFSLHRSSLTPISPLFPVPSRHLSLGQRKTPMIQILCKAVKRSPKRLKYTAPRLIKVILYGLYLIYTLFEFGLVDICLFLRLWKSMSIFTFQWQQKL